MKAVAVVCVVATCIACSDRKRDGFDKPTPPDMTALVEAYENPDGVLTQETVEVIADDVDARLDSIARLGVEEQLIDAIDDALAEAEAADFGDLEKRSDELATTRQGLSFSGDATLKVTRICNGWGPEPVPDKGENGFFRLNVNLSEKGVDPVIWGKASECKYLLSGAEVLVDAGTRGALGDLSAYIGSNATLDSFGDDPIILAFDLATSVDGVREPVALDFRIDIPTRAIEVRVMTAQGNVVVSAGSETLLSVRASNGVFPVATWTRSRALRTPAKWSRSDPRVAEADGRGARDDGRRPLDAAGRRVPHRGREDHRPDGVHDAEGGRPARPFQGPVDAPVARHGRHAHRAVVHPHGERAREVDLPSLRSLGAIRRRGRVPTRPLPAQGARGQPRRRDHHRWAPSSRRCPIGSTTS